MCEYNVLYRYSLYVRLYTKADNVIIACEKTENEDHEMTHVECE